MVLLAYDFLKKYSEEIEPWTILEFVKEYRKLNENRLAYLNIGYLKPEKFKEYKKKVLLKL